MILSDSQLRARQQLVGELPRADLQGCCIGGAN